MANTSSAKKAARKSEKRNEINKARKSRIRTFIKEVEKNIDAENEANARVAFKSLEPEIMRGVSKGVFKLNTASRKLKRLSSKIRKLKS